MFVLCDHRMYLEWSVEMGSKSFWELELGEKGRTVARELGRNGLILSGFSITALAFLLNLYGQNAPQNLLVVELYLVSLVTYFGMSEIARNAVYYWEYALADGLYIVASILLFSAVGGFVLSFRLGGEVFMLVCLLIAALVISLAYSAYGFRRMYRKALKEPPS